MDRKQRMRKRRKRRILEQTLWKMLSHRQRKTVRSISTDGSSEKETAEDTEDALTSVKELDRQEIEDLPVEDAQGEKEEKPVKVSYESQKKECTFSYQSLNMGIKESIVLTKAPEGNV